MGFISGNTNNYIYLPQIKLKNKNCMKYLICLIGLFVNLNVYSQLNLGIGSSIIIEDLDFGLQIRSAYSVSEKVAVSGAFSYYLEKGTSYGIDLDAQFKLFNFSKVNIAPMAGINIRKKETLNTGLQLGFFIQVENEGIDIYLEPKAILDTDTVIALAGGIYF